LDQLPTKTIEARKMWLETAKTYVSKYGSCSSVEAIKTNLDYFNSNIPKWEKTIKEMGDAAIKAELTGRFDTALKAKNFDNVYSSGKEILQKYPEEFRTAEIVLATVAGEEAFKGNNKYN